MVYNVIMMQTMKQKPLVTKESLQVLLTTEDREFAKRVVGRALVALLEKQTQDEREQKTTRVHNLQGFTPADARSGTLTALSFKKNKTLEDWMMDRWIKPNAKGVPRILKYAGQLNRIAMEKKYAQGR